MIDIKLQNTSLINLAMKSNIEKSSNLATCLEKWELFGRTYNKAHGSLISRDCNGLITEVTFFWNYFENAAKGYQPVKWMYIVLSDV
jgi:hypothetical protein